MAYFRRIPPPASSFIARGNVDYEARLDLRTVVPFGLRRITGPPLRGERIYVRGYLGKVMMLPSEGIYKRGIEPDLI